MYKAFIDTSVILRILVQDDNIKIKATDGTLKDVAPIVFSVK